MYGVLRPDGLRMTAFVTHEWRPMREGVCAAPTRRRWAVEGESVVRSLGSMSNLDPAVVDIVDARIGTTLKRKWRIDSLIGVGGMAAVYAATHRNGNRVAVKILHVQLCVDASLRTRFQREGYVANTVNHPGVVRVLDDDKTDDGAAFLVMDLLEGETAADRAERMGGRLPLHDVLKIGEELLDILAAAHASGVVHRDIKPENIFITRDRATRVLDFGIASLQSATKSSAGLTAGAMGTPAFMPPEQALGRMPEVDALSDVWAVGATLYTLLSGRLVHDHNTANEILVAAATRPAPSIAFFAPETPPDIVEVIDRALQFDKGQRWSSARAMHYALRQAAAKVAAPSDDAFAHPDSSMMRLAVAAGTNLDLADNAALPNLTHSGLVVGPPRAPSRARVFAMSAGLGVALLLAVAAFVRLRPGAPAAAASIESIAAPAPPPPPPPPVPSGRPEIVPFQDFGAAVTSPSSSAKPAAKPPRGKSPPAPSVEKSWLDRRK
jgi:hypothetical protein